MKREGDEKGWGGGGGGGGERDERSRVVFHCRNMFVSSSLKFYIRVTYRWNKK